MATIAAAQSGLFTESSTWVGGVAPVSGDVALLAGTSTPRVIVVTGATITGVTFRAPTPLPNGYNFGGQLVGTCDQLTVDPGDPENEVPAGTVDIFSGGSLTINGSMSVAGGFLVGSNDITYQMGAVTADGTLLVSGLLDVSGSGELIIETGASLTIDGSSVITLGYGSFFDVYSYSQLAGTLTLQAGAQLVCYSSSNICITEGSSLTIAAGSTLTLYEYGSLTVYSGSFTANGTLDIATYFDVTDDAINIASGVVGMGDGELGLAGAMTVTYRALLMLINGFTLNENECTVSFDNTCLLFIDNYDSSMVVATSVALGGTTLPGPITLGAGAWGMNYMPPDPDNVLNTDTNCPGNYDPPVSDDVRYDTPFGVDDTGELRIPAEADVLNGVRYGSPEAGALEGSYLTVAANDIRYDTPYGIEGAGRGTLHLPDETDVRDGTKYGANNTEKTGAYPAPAPAEAAGGMLVIG